MRDGRGGGVVLVGAGGHDDGAAVQSQLHHHRPHVGVDVVVDADHPRRADEQLARCRPPSPSARCLPSDGRRRSWSSSPTDCTSSQHRALDAGHVGQRAVRRDVADVREHDRQRGHRARRARSARRLSAARSNASSRSVGGVESVEAVAACDAVDRAVVAEDLAAGRGRRAHHRAADQAETQHADGCFVTASRLAHRTCRRTSGWCRLLVKAPGRGLALAPMGAQRAQAQDQAAGPPGRLRCGRRPRGRQVALLADASRRADQPGGRGDRTA